MAFPPDAPRDDDGRFSDPYTPREDWGGHPGDPDADLADPLFAGLVLLAVVALGLGLVVAVVEGGLAEGWLFWLISALAGVGAMLKVFLESDDDDDDPTGSHEVRF